MCYFSILSGIVGFRLNRAIPLMHSFVTCILFDERDMFIHYFIAQVKHLCLISIVVYGCSLRGFLGSIASAEPINDGVERLLHSTHGRPSPY